MNFIDGEMRFWIAVAIAGLLAWGFYALKQYLSKKTSKPTFVDNMRKAGLL